MAKAVKKAVKQSEPKMAVQSVPPMSYRITAKRDGFRRAGIVHSGTRDYGAGELSNAQLAAIEAEPLLVLERLKTSNEDEGGGAANSDGQNEGEVTTGTEHQETKDGGGI